MKFSDKILNFRKEKGLTNRAFARMIGKDETLVSRWSKADEPSNEFVMSILKVYPDFDLNYYLKNDQTYPQLENVESKAAEERDDYGKTVMDIIKEIEEKLELLKKKIDK